jgi:hypothetical protein
MLSLYCLQFSNEWKAKTCAREGKIPYFAAGGLPRAEQAPAAKSSIILPFPLKQGYGHPPCAGVTSARREL